MLITTSTNKTLRDRLGHHTRCLYHTLLYICLLHVDAHNHVYTQHIGIKIRASYEMFEPYTIVHMPPSCWCSYQRLQTHKEIGIRWSNEMHGLGIIVSSSFIFILNTYKYNIYIENRPYNVVLTRNCNTLWPGLGRQTRCVDCWLPSVAQTCFW